MKPKYFEQQTSVLNAPKNWDGKKYGECVGLPVMLHNDCFYSYWKPSMRERLILLFGGKVRLTVMQPTHPPVSIDALKEKEL